MKTKTGDRIIQVLLLIIIACGFGLTAFMFKNSQSRPAGMPGGGMPGRTAGPSAAGPSRRRPVRRRPGRH